MAEITKEFNSWISHTTKTDWIEIVNRLHQLDTNEIFFPISLVINSHNQKAYQLNLINQF